MKTNKIHYTQTYLLMVKVNEAKTLTENPSRNKNVS